MEPQYIGFDVPYYHVIGIISQLQGYFVGVSYKVAAAILLLSVFFGLLKYMMTGEGLRDFIIKQSMSLLIFTFLIFNYSFIITGLAKMSFNLANESYSVYGVDGHESGMSFTELIRARMAAKYAAAQERIQARVIENERAGTALDTMNQAVASKEAAEGSSSYDVTGIIDSTYGFMAPNAVLSAAFFVIGQIIDESDKYSLNPAAGVVSYFTGEPKTYAPLMWFLSILVMLVVLICTVFAVAEYMICTIEFTLVSSVGVILLPTMLWEGSKFMTEKLISAMIGFFLKLLFCTLALFLMFYGFLDLLQSTFGNGGLTDILKFIVEPVLYFLIVRSAPNLASALLTGSPSMNLGAAAGAVMGAKALAGAAAGGVARTGVAAANTGAKAISAGMAAKERGGRMSDALNSATRSLGNSAVSAVKSARHNLAHSLLSGGQKGEGGGAANKAANKDSSVERSKENGIRNTLRESIAAGRETGAREGSERKKERFDTAVADARRRLAPTTQSNTTANASAVSFTGRAS